jgi:hypothetical protein
MYIPLLSLLDVRPLLNHQSAFPTCLVSTVEPTQFTLVPTFLPNFFSVRYVHDLGSFVSGQDINKRL